MKKCPTCGHENNGADFRCPECGSYYSKIIELIDQEAAAEESRTWKARYRRIINADNIKQSLLLELAQIKSELPQQAGLVLWVIFIFVFALVFAF